MSSFLPCASIYAETLYDGRSHEAQSRVLIEVEAGRIVAVHAGTDPRDLPPEVMRVPMAMPGFIDLQINGAGDVQFNSECNRTGLEAMVAASARGGVTHIFPHSLRRRGRNIDRR
jgi:N-acetylglucosamine-6-phosphate deacetylase